MMARAMFRVRKRSGGTVNRMAGWILWVSSDSMIHVISVTAGGGYSETFLPVHGPTVGVDAVPRRSIESSDPQVRYELAAPGKKNQ